MKPYPTPDWLTVDDAAKLAGCHPQTIRRAILRGTLAATRWGNRYWIERAAFVAAGPPWLGAAKD